MKIAIKMNDLKIASTLARSTKRPQGITSAKIEERDALVGRGDSDEVLTVGHWRQVESMTTLRHPHALQNLK